MRLSELIGVVVTDADGVRIGQVRTAVARRTEQAPMDGPHAVTILIAAPGRIGTRLGYGHAQMAGPWPISAWLQRRIERGYAFGWEDVAAFEPGRAITLATSRSRLRSAADALAEVHR
jgi:hypothetical protein